MYSLIVFLLLFFIMMSCFFKILMVSCRQDEFTAFEKKMYKKQRAALSEVSVQV